jgi:uncharacterized protein
MAKYSLTQLDRLRLVNQFTLMKLAGAKDCDRVIKILASGYEGNYWEVFSGIESKTMSEENCTYVMDVLDLYRAIQHSTPENPRKTERGPEFMGFDANHEPSYGYAKFLMDAEASGWAKLKHKGLDSHMPTVDLYRPLLDKWVSWDKPVEMTEDQYYDLLDTPYRA